MTRPVVAQWNQMLRARLGPGGKDAASSLGWLDFEHELIDPADGRSVAFLPRWFALSFLPHRFAHMFAPSYISAVDVAPSVCPALRLGCGCICERYRRVS